MRTCLLLFSVLLAAACPAAGERLIDTGTPGSRGCPAGNGESLASRFVLDDTYSLAALYGYFDPVFRAGTLTVALYGDAVALPDTAEPCFRGTAGIGGAPGWYGAETGGVTLGPGAYWIAFESRDFDSFSGTMPRGAPAPLEGSARARYGRPYDNDGGPLGIGVRIDGEPVPEPATALLFAAALPLLFRARRRARGVP